MNMVPGAISTVAIAAILFLPITSATDVDQDSKSLTCASMTSCSSCLNNSYCSWCVTKSKCTKQSCGNDNVIYPKNIKALMSGTQFCPRIVKLEKELIFESGKRQIIVVKITQIYLYMAFTPWKCKINLGGEEKIVNAVLLADEVYCDSAELINTSGSTYVEGYVTVMWENNKSFDGIIPFKVCDCVSNSGCDSCSK